MKDKLAYTCIRIPDGCQLRPLKLTAKAVRSLQCGLRFTLVRPIGQLVAGAIGAACDRDGSWWWYNAQTRLVRLKPTLCRLGDWYWVQEGWHGEYYRANPPRLAVPIRHWQAAATMSLERSRFRLSVEHIVIQRRYAREGHHQPEATVLQPNFWRGTRLVDNPWCWFIECNVHAHTPHISP